MAIFKSKSFSTLSMEKIWVEKKKKGFPFVVLEKKLFYRSASNHSVLHGLQCNYNSIVQLIRLA